MPMYKNHVHDIKMFHLLYEGKSISKLQMDTEIKQIRVLI
jgi:hypothetical protein